MEHLLEQELGELAEDFVTLDVAEGDDFREWDVYEVLEDKLGWSGWVSTSLSSSFMEVVLPGWDFSGHEKDGWVMGDELSELELEASS